MKKESRHSSRPSYILGAAILATVSIAGCDSLRLAPSEQQKQNAWLHNRTAAVAAETAKTEQSSQELQALTQLSELQSRAFTSYCGLPKEYPQAETTEQILGESSWQLASAAVTESAARPDPWQVADSVLEFGIGLCALLGGVCGTRAVRFLTDARTKSQALKEIIEGNELFKKQQPSQAKAFKAAQQDQSPETRQLVAAMKG
jgi:outer membrane murein-binding lipoprotein Lpp